MDSNPQGTYRQFQAVHTCPQADAKSLAQVHNYQLPTATECHNLPSSVYVTLPDMWVNISPEPDPHEDGPKERRLSYDPTPQPLSSPRTLSSSAYSGPLTPSAHMSASCDWTSG